MRRHLLIVLLVPLLLPPFLAGSGRCEESPAWMAEMAVRDLGHRSGFRLRIFHEPGLVPLPPAAGRLFLVMADSAWGEESHFVPTDLAIEAGSDLVYRAEFEQASDLFGQALGGRLREGELQFGFVVAPRALELERFLPETPDSIFIRYAHHRDPLRAATPVERELWEGAVARPDLVAAINAWWSWLQLIESAPPMNAGEASLFAERIFPGQGNVLLEESVNLDALRNAILRVGERRLLHSPVRQRVAPSYPAAARQAGAHGLVVVLAYISTEGAVEDALVLSSNTVHLLNLAALAAAGEWRFVPARDDAGNPTDGWRLLPFQFKLDPGATAAVGGSGAAAGDSTAAYAPPRILKRAEAIYPEKAYRSRIEGTVVYRVTVDARGKLVKTLLLESVHPLLDQAALTSIEKTLFAPATRGAVPVEGDLDIPTTFGSQGR